MGLYVEAFLRGNTTIFWKKSPSFEIVFLEWNMPGCYFRTQSSDLHLFDQVSLTLCLRRWLLTHPPRNSLFSTVVVQGPAFTRIFWATPPTALRWGKSNLSLSEMGGRSLAGAGLELGENRMYHSCQIAISDNMECGCGWLKHNSASSQSLKRHGFFDQWGQSKHFTCLKPSSTNCSRVIFKACGETPVILQTWFLYATSMFQHESTLSFNLLQTSWIIFVIIASMMLSKPQSTLLSCL